MKSFVKKCKHAVRWRLKALMGKRHDESALFNTVLVHLMKSIGAPPVIFDVGAHHGESLMRYRSLFPSAILHAFEPDQDNFKTLKKNWGGKENIFLNNLGVSGAKGTLTFHRNLKSNTSGFHAINVESEWAKNRSARHDVAPEDFTEKSYDVPITDLDSYVRDHKITHINLLKIDTQGHEDEVLSGCKEALEKAMIDIVETEIIVGDAYVKSLQIYDLEKILIPLGYRFYAIDKEGDLFHTPSLSFNIIYVHKQYLEKISSVG